MTYRILYLGDDASWSTSRQRAEALRRLRHEVTHVNPRTPLPRGRLVGGVGVRLGLWPFALLVRRWLSQVLAAGTYDLAWVDGGPELDSGCYRLLQRHGCRIVNYVTDDPFGTRDGRKWGLYRRAVEHHDLTVVPRAVNVAEARRAGARRVVRTYFSYDPVAHRPLAEPPPRRDGVVFVGSWMPERGPFLASLLVQGLPLTIVGDHWHRAPEWSVLKRAWRGPAVCGADYVRAIAMARVALGLVSHANRDLHTQRSVEIPYIGGAAFCAERTVEHRILYREGDEALFWSDAAECANQCRRLLADERLRERLARAARARVLALRLGNDDVLAALLSCAAGNTGEHSLVEVGGGEVACRE